MHRRLAVLVTLILLAGIPALALEKGEFEAGLGVDYHLLDDSMGANNVPAPRLRFGWSVTDRLLLELAYQRVSSEDDFGEAADFDDVELDQAAFNLVYSFGEQDFQPLVLLGVGWADGSRVEEFRPKRFEILDDSSLLWQAGLGARFRPSRRWGVRVQALATRISLDDKGLTNLSAGLDFSLIWGRTK